MGLSEAVARDYHTPLVSISGEKLAFFLSKYHENESCEVPLRQP